MLWCGSCRGHKVWCSTPEGRHGADGLDREWCLGEVCNVADGARTGGDVSKKVMRCVR